jgi:hypothetical protein
VWPRFEIFLKNNLGIADGLKHQLLIGHDVISGNRPTGRIELCLGRSQFVQSCSSVIRWELIEFLRGVSMPVRRGNRNVTTAILG